MTSSSTFTWDLLVKFHNCNFLCSRRPSALLSSATVYHVIPVMHKLLTVDKNNNLWEFMISISQHFALMSGATISICQTWGSPITRAGGSLRGENLLDLCSWKRWLFAFPLCNLNVTLWALMISKVASFKAITVSKPSLMLVCFKTQMQTNH